MHRIYLPYRPFCINLNEVWLDERDSSTQVHATNLVANIDITAYGVENIENKIGDLALLMPIFMKYGMVTDRNIPSHYNNDALINWRTAFICSNACFRSCNILILIDKITNIRNSINTISTPSFYHITSSNLLCNCRLYAILSWFVSKFYVWSNSSKYAWTRMSMPMMW